MSKVLGTRRREGSVWPDDRAGALLVCFLIEGDRISRVDIGAGTLDGLEPGAAVAALLDRLFGERAALVAGPLDRAVRWGETARKLVTDAEGRCLEVALEPRGALIRVGFRDVSDIVQLVRESEGIPTRPAHGLPMPEHQLFGGAPLIGWCRSNSGAESWSGGEISFGDEIVRASEVLDLIDRQPLPRLGPGHEVDDRGIAQSRIEIARGRDLRLPLQIAEVTTEDGARLGFAVDASGAVAAERTLARFVQTMTETFAHLTVALAIFDRNQTLALFNPALARLWQLEPAWLARRPTLREILDTLRSARRIPEMRDYHGWRDGLTALFDDSEKADYEELWSLADGATIRVLARPHPHGSLAFIFDDVSERMRLEQRNRHMDDLITATLDRLHEGLAVFAPNGALQFVNAAFHEIWDTDPTAVTLDMHVSELCALTRRLTVQTDVWDRMAAFVTGEQTRRTWTARISLGSGRMMAARFAPLPDGSTMAVFADVTDSERIASALRERNEALEAAEQMRGAVLDQISHRLRTPLNTIFGFGELLASQRYGELNPRQSDYASGILEAASQLLDTVSEVTELASLQIDPLEGEDAGAAVEEILDLTRGLLDKRAAEAGVSLSIDIDGPVGLIDRNPVRLRQLIFNMTADALFRCASGGCVTLEARRLADGAVEIGTRETTDVSDGSALSQIELHSLTLSLVRRIVASEAGALEITARPGGGEIRVCCRFPEMPPAG